MNDKGYQPSFPIEDVNAAPRRLCMLLWGLAAAGKTTWAATAPGQKLILSFGDNEAASLIGRKDVQVMPIYKYKTEDIFKFGADAFGLDRFLYENRQYQTVICDSVTMLQQRALERSVEVGLGASPRFTPTMMTPGQSAYGGRLALSLMVMDALMRVTAKHNVHLIFTAHENEAVTVPDGKGGQSVIDITVTLGGKLMGLTTSRLSEIWHLRTITGRDYRIVSIRPQANRRPMRSKIFSNKGEPSFIVEYDPERPDTDKDQMTIAKFYQQWERSNGKIPVPDNRPGGKKEDNAGRPVRELPKRTLPVISNKDKRV